MDWTDVVQARESEPGEHMYTVAVQTDSAGLIYLAVSVARTPAGTLALTGYPAFVGAPASGPAQVSARLREVSDTRLATVVQRALRNYLASSSAELAADLTGGARVSLPTLPLSLQTMQSLQWAPRGTSVLATVQARDARGAEYTLTYELDVTHAHDRWEIAAVQMDPDA